MDLTKTQKDNLEVINNFIGYGHPEKAELFIFAIEEHGDKTMPYEKWNIKFKMVYDKKFRKINGPFSLGSEDFEEYCKEFENDCEKNKIVARKSKIYKRYVRIYNSLYSDSITIDDLGSKLSDKLFIGNIFPISKPNTTNKTYGKADSKLFGTKNFDEWGKYWETRKNAIKQFLNSVKTINCIRIFTFNGTQIEKCKNLFQEIFDVETVKSDFNCKGKGHFFVYKSKNFEIFNCYSLSRGWVSDNQLIELGLLKI